MISWRIPDRRKKLVALRVFYMAGYTGYFAEQVRRMLAGGYALDELLVAAIDEGMRKMIHDAAAKE